jgi:hypothetical protein
VSNDDANARMREVERIAKQLAEDEKRRAEGQRRLQEEAAKLENDEKD